MPGVLHILTHENRPTLGKFKFFGQGGEAVDGESAVGLRCIDHEGEIVALVVAEQLRSGARGSLHMVAVDL